MRVVAGKLPFLLEVQVASDGGACGTGERDDVRAWLVYSTLTCEQRGSLAVGNNANIAIFDPQSRNLFLGPAV
ncbi:MAG: hypothetical protein JO121_09565 [Deltaproteobacteria bacterium]|nr:hypothetical protein [Deltaproteobacteria bacterium]